MNQAKKLILTAIVTVALLAGAAAGYSYLSRHYTPSTDGALLPTPEETAEATDVGETESADDTNETAAETEVPLEPAPDFTVQNTAGETVALSDFIGKPVIINFWASWCAPCKSELPAFNKAHGTYGDDISFLMVNLTDGVEETIAGVTSFFTDGGYTFPLYFDTEAAAATTYGAYSIPLTVFVDAKGNLLGGHRGAMDYETLEQYVNILLTYYAEP